MLDSICEKESSKMDFTLGLITGAYAVFALIVFYIVYIIEVKLDLPGLINNHTAPQSAATCSHDPNMNMPSEFSEISQTRLRQMIESIIAETLRMSPLGNGSVSEAALNMDSRSNRIAKSLPLGSGNVRLRHHHHRTEQYFEPKIYQDLLATAVLNKIADKEGNIRLFSESTPDLSSYNIDSNFNVENQSTSSGSSVEPRSDFSYTDTEKSPKINKVPGRESVLSDYIAAHTVPLPDLSAAVTESEDDDHASISSSILAEGTWEDNWLFKKKRSSLTASITGSVGMLVPAPKDDVRAQIGDKTTDEISDLSEMGSDTDDSSSKIICAKFDPLNDRILNKHLIGGQNTKVVLDELIETASLISNTSQPRNEPKYTETRNEHIVEVASKVEALNTSIANSSPQETVLVYSESEHEQNPSPAPSQSSEDTKDEDDCTGFSTVESFEQVPSEHETRPVSQGPSVIEILAAMTLGPMLAVPASEQPPILTASELSSLKELSDLALAEIKARTPEVECHSLDIIDEEEETKIVSLSENKEPDADEDKSANINKKELQITDTKGESANAAAITGNQEAFGSGTKVDKTNVVNSIKVADTLLDANVVTTEQVSSKSTQNDDPKQREEEIFEETLKITDKSPVAITPEELETLKTPQGCETEQAAEVHHSSLGAVTVGRKEESPELDSVVDKSMALGTTQLKEAGVELQDSRVTGKEVAPFIVENMTSIEANKPIQYSQSNAQETISPQIPHTSKIKAEEVLKYGQLESSVADEMAINPVVADSSEIFCVEKVSNLEDISLMMAQDVAQNVQAKENPPTPTTKAVEISQIDCTNEQKEESSQISQLKSLNSKPPLVAEASSGYGEKSADGIHQTTKENPCTLLEISQQQADNSIPQVSEMDQESGPQTESDQPKLINVESVPLAVADEPTIQEPPCTLLETAQQQADNYIPQDSEIQQETLPPTDADEPTKELDQVLVIDKVKSPDQYIQKVTTKSLTTYIESVAVLNKDIESESEREITSKSIIPDIASEPALLETSTVEGGQVGSENLLPKTKESKLSVEPISANHESIPFQKNSQENSREPTETVEKKQVHDTYEKIETNINQCTAISSECSQKDIKENLTPPTAVETFPLAELDLPSDPIIHKPLVESELSPVLLNNEGIPSNRDIRNSSKSKTPKVNELDLVKIVDSDMLSHSLLPLDTTQIRNNEGDTKSLVDLHIELPQSITPAQEPFADEDETSKKIIKEIFKEPKLVSVINADIATDEVLQVNLRSLVPHQAIVVDTLPNISEEIKSAKSTQSNDMKTERSGADNEKPDPIAPEKLHSDKLHETTVTNKAELQTLYPQGSPPETEIVATAEVELVSEINAEGLSKKIIQEVALESTPLKINEGVTRPTAAEEIVQQATMKRIATESEPLQTYEIKPVPVSLEDASCDKICQDNSIKLEPREMVEVSLTQDISKETQLDITESIDTGIESSLTKEIKSMQTITEETTSNQNFKQATLLENAVREDPAAQPKPTQSVELGDAVIISKDESPETNVQKVTTESSSPQIGKVEQAPDAVVSIIKVESANPEIPLESKTTSGVGEEPVSDINEERLTNTTVEKVYSELTPPQFDEVDAEPIISAEMLPEKSVEDICTELKPLQVYEIESVSVSHEDVARDSSKKTQLDIAESIDTRTESSPTKEIESMQTITQETTSNQILQQATLPENPVREESAAQSKLTQSVVLEDTVGISKDESPETVVENITEELTPSQIDKLEPVTNASANFTSYKIVQHLPTESEPQQTDKQVPQPFANEEDPLETPPQEIFMESRAAEADTEEIVNEKLSTEKNVQDIEIVPTATGEAKQLPFVNVEIPPKTMIQKIRTESEPSPTDEIEPELVTNLEIPTNSILQEIPREEELLPTSEVYPVPLAAVEMLSEPIIESQLSQTEGESVPIKTSNIIEKGLAKIIQQSGSFSPTESVAMQTDERDTLTVVAVSDSMCQSICSPLELFQLNEVTIVNEDKSSDKVVQLIPTESKSIPAIGTEPVLVTSEVFPSDNCMTSNLSQNVDVEAVKDISAEMLPRTIIKECASESMSINKVEAVSVVGAEMLPNFITEEISAKPEPQVDDVETVPDKPVKSEPVETIDVKSAPGTSEELHQNNAIEPLLSSADEIELAHLAIEELASDNILQLPTVPSNLIIEKVPTNSKISQIGEAEKTYEADPIPKVNVETVFQEILTEAESPRINEVEPATVVEMNTPSESIIQQLAAQLEQTQAAEVEPHLIINEKIPSNTTIREVSEDSDILKISQSKVVKTTISVADDNSDLQNQTFELDTNPDNSADIKLKTATQNYALETEPSQTNEEETEPPELETILAAEVEPPLDFNAKALQKTSVQEVFSESTPPQISEPGAVPVVVEELSEPVSVTYNDIPCDKIPQKNSIKLEPMKTVEMNSELGISEKPQSGKISSIALGSEIPPLCKGDPSSIVNEKPMPAKILLLPTMPSKPIMEETPTESLLRQTDKIDAVPTGLSDEFPKALAQEVTIESTTSQTDKGDLVVKVGFKSEAHPQEINITSKAVLPVEASTVASVTTELPIRTIAKEMLAKTFPLPAGELETKPFSHIEKPQEPVTLSKIPPNSMTQGEPSGKIFIETSEVDSVPIAEADILFEPITQGIPSELELSQMVEVDALPITDEENPSNAIIGKISKESETMNINKLEPVNENSLDLPSNSIRHTTSAPAQNNERDTLSTVDPKEAINAESESLEQNKTQQVAVVDEDEAFAKSVQEIPKELKAMPFINAVSNECIHVDSNTTEPHPTVEMGTLPEINSEKLTQNDNMETKFSERDNEESDPAVPEKLRSDKFLQPNAIAYDITTDPKPAQIVQVDLVPFSRKVSIDPKPLQTDEAVPVSTVKREPLSFPAKPETALESETIPGTGVEPLSDINAERLEKPILEKVSSKSTTAQFDEADVEPVIVAETLPDEPVEDICMEPDSLQIYEIEPVSVSQEDVPMETDEMSLTREISKETDIDSTESIDTRIENAPTNAIESMQIITQETTSNQVLQQGTLPKNPDTAAQPKLKQSVLLEDAVIISKDESPETIVQEVTTESSSPQTDKVEPISNASEEKISTEPTPPQFDEVDVKPAIAVEALPKKSVEDICTESKQLKNNEDKPMQTVEVSLTREVSEETQLDITENIDPRTENSPTNAIESMQIITQETTSNQVLQQGTLPENPDPAAQPKLKQIVLLEDAVIISKDESPETIVQEVTTESSSPQTDKVEPISNASEEKISTEPTPPQFDEVDAEPFIAVEALPERPIEDICTESKQLQVYEIEPVSVSQEDVPMETDEMSLTREISKETDIDSTESIDTRIENSPTNAIESMQIITQETTSSQVLQQGTLPKNPDSAAQPKLKQSVLLEGAVIISKDESPETIVQEVTTGSSSPQTDKVEPISNASEEKISTEPTPPQFDEVDVKPAIAVEALPKKSVEGICMESKQLQNNEDKPMQTVEVSLTREVSEETQLDITENIDPRTENSPTNATESMQIITQETTSSQALQQGTLPKNPDSAAQPKLKQIVLLEGAVIISKDESPETIVQEVTTASSSPQTDKVEPISNASEEKISTEPTPPQFDEVDVKPAIAVEALPKKSVEGICMESKQLQNNEDKPMQTVEVSLTREVSEETQLDITENIDTRTENSPTNATESMQIITQETTSNQVLQQGTLPENPDPAAQPKLKQSVLLEDAVIISKDESPETIVQEVTTESSSPQTDKVEPISNASEDKISTEPTPPQFDEIDAEPFIAVEALPERPIEDICTESKQLQVYEIEPVSVSQEDVPIETDEMSLTREISKETDIDSTESIDTRIENSPTNAIESMQIITQETTSNQVLQQGTLPENPDPTAQPKLKQSVLLEDAVIISKDESPETIVQEVTTESSSPQTDKVEPISNASEEKISTEPTPPQFDEVDVKPAIAVEALPKKSVEDICTESKQLQNNEDKPMQTVEVSLTREVSEETQLDITENIDPRTENSPTNAIESMQIITQETMSNQVLQQGTLPENPDPAAQPKLKQIVLLEDAVIISKDESPETIVQEVTTESSSPQTDKVEPISNASEEKISTEPTPPQFDEVDAEPFIAVEALPERPIEDICTESKQLQVYEIEPVSVSQEDVPMETDEMSLTREISKETDIDSTESIDTRIENSPTNAIESMQIITQETTSSQVLQQGTLPKNPGSAAQPKLKQSVLLEGAVIISKDESPETIVQEVTTESSSPQTDKVEPISNASEEKISTEPTPPQFDGVDVEPAIAVEALPKKSIEDICRESKQLQNNEDKPMQTVEVSLRREVNEETQLDITESINTRVENSPTDAIESMQITTQETTSNQVLQQGTLPEHSDPAAQPKLKQSVELEDAVIISKDESPETIFQEIITESISSQIAKVVHNFPSKKHSEGIVLKSEPVISAEVDAEEIVTDELLMQRIVQDIITKIKPVPIGETEDLQIKEVEALPAAIEHILSVKSEPDIDNAEPVADSNADLKSCKSLQNLPAESKPPQSDEQINTQIIEGDNFLVTSADIELNRTDEAETMSVLVESTSPNTILLQNPTKCTSESSPAADAQTRETLNVLNEASPTILNPKIEAAGQTDAGTPDELQTIVESPLLDFKAQTLPTIPSNESNIMILNATKYAEEESASGVANLLSSETAKAHNSTETNSENIASTVEIKNCISGVDSSNLQSHALNSEPIIICQSFSAGSVEGIPNISSGNVDENLSQQRSLGPDKNPDTCGMTFADSLSLFRPMSKRLCRQSHVVDTTSSDEDCSPRFSNHLASLSKTFIRDKRLLAALEKQRRQTEIMQKYLRSIDSFETDFDYEYHSQTVLSEQTLILNTPPPPLPIDDVIAETDDYLIKSLSDCKFNFLNDILFSDQLSSDSNRTDESAPTTVESYLAECNNELEPQPINICNSTSAKLTNGSYIDISSSHNNSKVNQEDHFTNNNSNHQPDINGEEDDVIHLRYFVPGSIAEREYKKWNNAVEMPNNPYAPEALKRRISGSQERFMDLPNITPSTEKSPISLIETGAADDSCSEVDYKRYSRDYYINDDKVPKTSPKHQIVATDGSRLNPNISDEPVADIAINEPIEAHFVVYEALPAQVVEENASIETLSNQSMQSTNTTTSDDSDTVRIYDFKNQRTTILRSESKTSTNEFATKDSSEPTLQAAITISTSIEDSPTNSPNADEASCSGNSTTIARTPITTTRGSTPMAFKFLQPKRKLIDPSKILSQDEGANVVTPEFPAGGKVVVEEEVAQVMPSVKALAQAFLLSSNKSSPAEKRWKKGVHNIPSVSHTKSGVLKKNEASLSIVEIAEDATIASDLSSLETDPPTNKNLLTTTSRDTLLSASPSTITPPAEHTTNAEGNKSTTNALRRVSMLKSNIAFFENLRFK